MKKQWIVSMAAAIAVAGTVNVSAATLHPTMQASNPAVTKESHEQFLNKLEGLVQKYVLKKHKNTTIERTATFQMPNGQAEITASTPDGNTLAVTEASLGQITIVSIADMNDIHVKGTVSFKNLSAEAEVTSVTVTPDGKYALAAVRAGDHLYAANKGFIAVVNLDEQSVVKTYEVGIGPDSIALSKNGEMLVICNEDEEGDPNDDFEIDMDVTARPGSISILEFPNGDVLKGVHTELPITLSETDNRAVYKHDPQPEYVSISPNGRKAAVTLQENNAIVMIDLKKKQVEATFGLGVTMHKADLKKDGTVSITNDMTARFEPDGITWDPSGKFVMTANEGDLGKNEFKDGVKSGGRNIAVWDTKGNLVYDSMSLIDEKTAEAALYPDSRSENRGSEVENLTTGMIQGSPILAVASERANAVLFFDVTFPMYPVYLGLAPSGGKAPEGIHKINGRNIFVSADEADGILSFYTIQK